MLVVNPILVQATRDDLPDAPDNAALAHHAADPVAEDAFDRRLRGQLRPGAHTGGYVDLDRPDDLDSLSERRRGEYRIARLISGGVDDALPYFLAETALHADRLYQDLWACFEGRAALLRVEEGLTWRAMELRRELEASLPAEGLDGKTFVRFPGFDSPIATAGWWTDAHDDDPERRAATCIREIPSCEVFMAQEILDQARYAEGGGVVRIVPSSMEDREVSAVRALAHLGRLPPLRHLVTIVVNPGGDVKKVRSWTDRGCPDRVRSLIAPLRVNSMAKQRASRLTDRIHHERALADGRRGRESRTMIKNQSYGTLADRVATLVGDHQPVVVLAEESRPGPGRTADTLLELATALPITVTAATATVDHFAGVGTNNVIELTLSLPVSLPMPVGPPLPVGSPLPVFPPGQARTEATVQVIFSRVSGAVEQELLALPSRFGDDGRDAWERLIMLLRDPATVPFYHLVVGRRS